MDSDEKDKEHEHHGLGDKLKHPFPELREKLKGKGNGFEIGTWKLGPYQSHLAGWDRKRLEAVLIDLPRHPPIQPENQSQPPQA